MGVLERRRGSHAQSLRNFSLLHHFFLEDAASRSLKHAPKLNTLIKCISSQVSVQQCGYTDVNVFREQMALPGAQKNSNPSWGTAI